MDSNYVEELRIKVKDALKEDLFRYRHSLGVADTCACLAMRYGIDMERAYIAGLLHDCAKCVPDQQKIEECKSNNIDISEVELNSPYLLHSKLGAFYAKMKYNITDEEICTAIKWHTTGKPHMTLLEQICFLADYIEPLRNKAPDLDEIRALAFVDIDKATFVVLEHTIDYVLKSGRVLDEQTFLTYNYYKNKIN